MIAVCASAVHDFAQLDTTDAKLCIDDTGAEIMLELHCLWEDCK